jgi:hypothetical protein
MSGRMLDPKPRRCRKWLERNEPDLCLCRLHGGPVAPDFRRIFRTEVFAAQTEAGAFRRQVVAASLSVPEGGAGQLAAQKPLRSRVCRSVRRAVDGDLTPFEETPAVPVAWDRGA